MKFHDAHCHLQSKSFLKNFDIETSMKQWKKTGLEYLIGVSTKYSESAEVIELSKKYNEIIPAIGIHPWSAKKKLEEDIKHDFISLVRKNPNIVIGEIGLDHHFITNQEYYSYQEEHLRFFLELSEKYHCPVNIHLKGAEKDVEEILLNYKIPHQKILIHWYSGSVSVFRKLSEREYFFSINPSILTGSQHIKVLEEAALSQILTESDGNVKYTINGKKVIGSPEIIPEVINKIVEVKKASIGEISLTLQKNLRRYLNLK